MLSLPVVVSIPAVVSNKEREAGAPRPAHHTGDGAFQNPWASYESLGNFNPTVLWVRAVVQPAVLGRLKS